MDFTNHTRTIWTCNYTCKIWEARNKPLYVSNVRFGLHHVTRPNLKVKNSIELSSSSNWGREKTMYYNSVIKLINGLI